MIMMLFVAFYQILQIKNLHADDFNLPWIDWDTHQSNDLSEDCFANKLIDANFKQCISFNTTKSSCSDLVPANDISLITSINRLDGLEKTLIIFRYKLEKLVHQKSNE